MKLYFMKQKALDYIKANISTLYKNYYREKDNQWVFELFEEDPFEVFMEIPDFQLAPIPKEANKKGALDIENCKIIYTKLMNISESQAADERLWAGLCHSVFYDYVRERWNYTNKPFKNETSDVGGILTRFFFKDRGRSGFYRNTLSKCWWVGRTAYKTKSNNKFELLDALGPDDFSSKVTDLFYSYTFSSNINILSGVCKAWKLFNDRKKLSVREYFRPALQYFNALGGGMLLDILSEDEVKTIFFDYLAELYKEEDIGIAIDEDPSNEEYDQEEDAIISSQIQQLRDVNATDLDSKDVLLIDTGANVVIGQRDATDTIDAALVGRIEGPPEKVEYGCTVLLEKTDGPSKRTYEYRIPKDKDQAKKENVWYGIYDSMLGHIVGYEFYCGGNFKIIQIMW